MIPVRLTVGRVTLNHAVVVRICRGEPVRERHLREWANWEATCSGRRLSCRFESCFPYRPSVGLQTSGVMVSAPLLQSGGSRFESGEVYRGGDHGGTASPREPKWWNGIRSRLRPGRACPMWVRLPPSAPRGSGVTADTRGLNPLRASAHASRVPACGWLASRTRSTGRYLLRELER